MISTYKRKVINIEEMTYKYWLFRLKGISNRKKIELVTLFNSASEVYNASEGKLVQLGKLNEKQIDAIKCSIEKNNLEDYSYLEKKGAKLTTYDMDNYPKRLRDIHNPPYGLLYIGKLPSNNRRSVAIIGARRCSQYGEYLAQEFGSYLAQRDIQIISGLARGIDGISQFSAIEKGGSSFGILGCGVNICYPSENIHIYNELKESGGIISEYDIDYPPLAQNFPARNRLISGLVDAVLVIEAKEKSGTLITVDFALEQGRDVYAVPGRVVDPLSYGCNYLIKQGAAIVLSPKDLYREICPYTKKVNESENVIKVENDLQGIKKDIVDVLDNEPLTIDEVLVGLIKLKGEYIDLSITSLMKNLMELTMDGEIVQKGGNLFCKIFACTNRKYGV